MNFSMTPEHLARTLAEARKRERERCAKIADEYADAHSIADIVVVLREVAGLIRAATPTQPSVGLSGEGQAAYTPSSDPLPPDGPGVPDDVEMAFLARRALGR